MKINSKKFRLFFILTAFLASITLRADEHTVYGLSRLSDAEKKHLEHHTHKVIEVVPNAIGKERIQYHLEANNISSDHISYGSLSPEFITLQTTTQEAVQRIKTATPLPSSVNNSLLPSFPPIGDQGQIGSCVAWGSTYYQASHELGLLNGFNNKTSSTHILSPKWTYDMINQGNDQGSSPPDAYALLSTSGAVNILTFPYDTNYTAWDLNSSDWISAISNRMAPYALIPGLDSDLTAIKATLNNGHVVTFVTFIDSWVFTRIKYDPTNLNNSYVGEYACIYMNGQSGGHFMTIVGYDDTLWIDINGNGSVNSGERGAFLVANSWGTGWGNAGFIWIAYDAFLPSSAVINGPRNNRIPAGIGLNSNVIAIVPKAQNYSPSLIAEFSISQTKRNQITAQIGFSNTNQNTPTSLIPILNQQGGALEFDGEGSTTLGTVTFAADLTDFLPVGSTATNRYYLSIADSTRNNPTTLNSFTLIDPVHNTQTSNSSLPKIFDNSKGTLFIDYAFKTPSPTPTPFSLSFTSPSDGATLTGVVPITITATNNTPISSVALYMDSTLMNTWTSSPYQYSLDTTTLSNGSHQIRAIATDSSQNTTQSSITVQTKNAINIYTNAGGPSLSFGGSTWASDNGIYNGTTSTSSSKLSFSNPIYATSRSGNMTYTYAIPNGKYVVTLKFAENTFKSSKQRVFSTYINGIKVITKLDLFSKAGFGKPYDLSFPVTVKNGNLVIVFSSDKNLAQINGIQIKSQ